MQQIIQVLIDIWDFIGMKFNIPQRHLYSAFSICAKNWKTYAITLKITGIWSHIFDKQFVKAILQCCGNYGILLPQSCTYVAKFRQILLLLNNFTLNWFDEKNKTWHPHFSVKSTLLLKKWPEITKELISRKYLSVIAFYFTFHRQCGNFVNSLSLNFGKNFVKE